MLDRLFALETFGIKLGLENISRLCAELGHPERAFTTLHIAGTNGKGSVAAMTHAALLAAGHRSARYTSPHLTDITERFVVGGAPVPAAVLERVATRVLDCADRLQASGALRAPPTFFEATTAAAFEIFREAGVTVAVIEVGLGGRFDATNVIAPVAGAITTIGLDHQQHLGQTLAEIAFEKAGIVKRGMTVVMGALPDEASAVVRRAASERGARLVAAAEGATVASEMVGGAARVQITTPERAYGPITLGLRGRYQIENALVAVRLLEAADAHGIGLTPEAVAAALAQPSWPARLELFELARGQRVLLDSAHNLDGALALVGYIREWYMTPPALVLGVMRDKDVDAMLRILLPEFSRVVVTAAPTPRAIPAGELARRASDVAAALGRGSTGASPLTITAVDDPVDAVAQALARSNDVCVAGSIFLAGAVRPALHLRAASR